MKRNPVQSWSFENESVVRIGRSTDNHVILYSAVVSRHHVELRQSGTNWEIVNLGTNGTYLDGKRITKVPVVDGAIIRLARSGPNIQIRLGMEALKELPDHLASDALAGQRIDHHATVTDITDAGQPNLEQAPSQDASDADDDPPTGLIPVPPHLRIPKGEDAANPPSSEFSTSAIARAQMSQRSGLASSPVPLAQQENRRVSHRRSNRVTSPDLPGSSNAELDVVGDYRVLEVLGQGDVGITYLAERKGEPLVLKTLNSDWINHPNSKPAMEVEAELLEQLSSPSIPKLLDFFVVDNRPYLAMEKIDGSLLSQQVKQTGSFPLKQAIAKVLKVCDILSYLHHFVPPVLHRNIEASNVMCREPSDDVVLIGFGAVKSLVLGRKEAVGSHGCTPPEQLSVNATPQVDLYGLAPMLAYLLTGKNPVTFCRRQDGERYQFMADALTGFSNRLLTIIRRLTHADHSYHYPSVEAVSDDLRALLTT
ncbi:MAG: FHA domain-containing protein [Leptolyngbyaceae bacterium]|nr:FHA domain-containing protein [Leptolyngbyaceae bacterium]